MKDRRRPKRDLLGMMLRLADMRKKAEEDEAKSLVITQRLTLASMFILLGIKLFLAVDVFLLKTEPVDDAISQVVPVSVKSSTEYRLETRDGRYIKIDPTGYESSGDKLRIDRTVIFHIPVRIFLKEKNIYVNRAADGYNIARYCSLIFMAVALLSFVFKEKILKDNYFIMYTIAGITLVQIVLLLI